MPLSVAGRGDGAGTLPGPGELATGGRDLPSSWPTDGDVDAEVLQSVPKPAHGGGRRPPDRIARRRVEGDQVDVGAEGLGERGEAVHVVCAIVDPVHQRP